ncbi:iron complex transport system permease protein [Bacillus oleivorans]|uniref:Iron complex transport system permease protein n=1 Tax=Bacillus oleivorans TaxID=1448271 RepID=A0A285D3U8_9BACI|nr:iron chelate uptake ABC transporter family permease subunit [Bacillus oleivorans]SNX74480.1 iron complex transport system permease protein [Bacillus oleivorans]
MSNKNKLLVLTAIAILLISLFLFFDIGSNWDYVLPRRVTKIVAIVLAGAAIAYSTLVFQTITNNRILTPSILGLDSLYLLIQTIVVFLFGSATVMMMQAQVNFLISLGLMVIFSSILFKLLFKKEGQNIYFLLLIGLIFGTLFESFSSFMQVLIDPNEFLIVQDRMFASLNNVNSDIIWIALILLAAAFLYSMKFIKYLDVMSMGREHAINLGIDYDYVVKRLLLVVAILISIPTALIGPITFLGLLVVNVTYEFLKTYQHKFLIIGSVLVSIVALVGGQLIVERIFTFSVPISVIINFIGGIYFIYLLLKERKSW